MTERETVNLDKLQAEASRLVELLTDRHPGLASWREAYHRTVQAIANETGYMPTIKGDHS